MRQTKNTIHTPVLLRAVVDMAAPAAGESYLDLTAGYGGHARAIIDATSAPRKSVLVDRDTTAITALQDVADAGATLMHQDFLAASQELVEQGQTFDIIVADLGVSSLHLDKAERGFAFSTNGPLDMRMDQSTVMTAATVVNTWSEDQLVKLLREYGEEWRAPSIARAIIAARPLETTNDLADVVKRAVRGHAGKTHPATKTFQAIRIAVNDELRQLEYALPLWLKLLAPHGRLLVISFHSLEDRLVKQAFADVSGDRYDAGFRLLAKRPVTADESELAFNPRARSAKLRGVAKINTKERGTT